MVDVAPTIAALLGTNIPGTDQGQPQVDMLDFSLSQVDKIHNVLSIQQGQLAIAYETAIGKPVIVQASDDFVTATQEAMDAARESRLNSERLPRGILAIVFVLLIINLVAWNSKPNFTWFLLGVVTYLVVFNFKYVLIDHKTYSLSSVLDATNLIMSTAITTLYRINDWMDCCINWNEGIQAKIQAGCHYNIEIYTYDTIYPIHPHFYSLCH